MGHCRRLGLAPRPAAGALLPEPPARRGGGLALIILPEKEKERERERNEAPGLDGRNAQAIPALADQ